MNTKKRWHSSDNKYSLPQTDLVIASNYQRAVQIFVWLVKALALNTDCCLAYKNISAFNETKPNSQQPGNKPSQNHNNKTSVTNHKRKHARNEKHSILKLNRNKHAQTFQSQERNWTLQ